MSSEPSDSAWYAVSLTVTSDALGPGAITAALAISPTESAHTGERRGNDPRTRPYQTNFWTVRVTDDTMVPFEEQLPPFLDRLEARPDAVALLHRPDVEANLFLGFARHGLGWLSWFPAELLARVGALGLGITIDLYPPNSTIALRKYERARALRSSVR